MVFLIFWDQICVMYSLLSFSECHFPFMFGGRSYDQCTECSQKNLKSISKKYWNFHENIYFWKVQNHIFNLFNAKHMYTWDLFPKKMFILWDIFTYTGLEFLCICGCEVVKGSKKHIFLWHQVLLMGGMMGDLGVPQQLAMTRTADGWSAVVRQCKNQFKQKNNWFWSPALIAFENLRFALIENENLRFALIELENLRFNFQCVISIRNNSLRSSKRIQITF